MFLFWQRICFSNPFHKGILRNPNHRAPNQQLTISWCEHFCKDICTAAAFRDHDFVDAHCATAHGVGWRNSEITHGAGAYADRIRYLTSASEAQVAWWWQCKCNQRFCWRMLLPFKVGDQVPRSWICIASATPCCFSTSNVKKKAHRFHDQNSKSSILCTWAVEKGTSGCLSLLLDLWICSLFWGE